MRTPAKWQEKAILWNKQRSSGKKLKAEGCNVINDLLTTEAESIEWPENTVPKFTTKRGTKMTKVAYDNKTK